MDEAAERERVALLGDLVASRDTSDRVGLHARVRDALEAANAVTAPLDPLRVTVGDEFQGVFATLGAALGAAYRVRLALVGVTDVRFGVGRGEVVVVDAERNIQDGAAWWAARAAIDEVEGRARGARAGLRTGIAPVAGEPGRDADVSPALSAAVTAAVSAAVTAVDGLLAGLDPASARILALLVDGHPQSMAAAELGITASAVSQRVARGQLAVAADAIARLESLP